MKQDVVFVRGSNWHSIGWLDLCQTPKKLSDTFWAYLQSFTRAQGLCRGDTKGRRERKGV